MDVIMSMTLATDYSGGRGFTALTASLSTKGSYSENWNPIDRMFSPS